MEFECRTCLKLSSNVRNIFSNDLSFKIEAISSVEISQDERFSSKICEGCVANVTQMYEFRQVIQTSNVILMSRCIKEEAVVETETEDIKLEFKQERIFEDFAIETPEIFRYSLCDFSSSQYGLWKSHKKKHRKPTCTKSSVMCFICNKMCRNERALSWHMFTHEIGPHHCRICGKVYRHRIGYNNHAKLHDTTGGVKTVECATCGKLFLDKKTLVSHLYTHTGERPFPCRYCDRGFGSSDLRNTHESFACIHFYSEETRLNNALLD